jgi:hypothetical protein
MTGLVVVTVPGMITTPADICDTAVADEITTPAVNCPTLADPFETTAPDVSCETAALFTGGAAYAFIVITANIKHARTYFMARS